jgi:hypothetical protein
LVGVFVGGVVGVLVGFLVGDTVGTLVGDHVSHASPPDGALMKQSCWSAGSNEVISAKKLQAPVPTRPGPPDPTSGLKMYLKAAHSALSKHMSSQAESSPTRKLLPLLIAAGVPLHPMSNWRL